MLAVTTFMSALIALMYYALMSNVLIIENKIVEVLISLIIFGFVLGVMIVKYSRYKYEDLSKWKYLGGLIVWGVLALSVPSFFESWKAAQSTWQTAYLVWMALLWGFIFILPIWDITYTEGEEHAHV